MNWSEIIRAARLRAGLSQRELALRAGTSHSTLSAYESGRVDPGVATMQRIVAAAGFVGEVRLSRRARERDGMDRGDELELVLELAGQFPAREPGKLMFPGFTP